ncbi:hypothetical protein NK553_03975 [Pseudomonas sp. ZM23]|uniref:Lysozyme n=1 Tax=Pseudomonas triclosanedens TaxID=2961893 RepID=A0ABY7A2D7_9PSED|nr:hypothetical protein [Pseudomonas triclosanedens]MCP8463100.1 hypothetical protein [Pseudomonas triclosanedens]MCP8468720.1 hypothetical protein [Pseudomonas triclosanedens]MCP8475442.1 hypothetical protein [Pseudomonas triclosanedens]WAI50274.1 hypothetical protein OU419_03095 [Pseudomonas triclosanedens]
MSRLPLTLVLAALVLGTVLGAWVTASFYRGRMETLRIEQARCGDSRQALEALLAQQNSQIDALQVASRERTEAAERALAAARGQADAHEAAARRLLQERSDGDECMAVRQLIDRELLR